MIRISLIIAIVAGLAVGALNFVKVKEIITKLRDDLQTQTTRADNAEHERDKFHADLDKTTKILTQTQLELTNTIKLKDQAVAEAATQVKRANQINDELTRTKSDLADKSSKLAQYEASGLNPEQALTAAKELKKLGDMLAGSQDENQVLGKKIKRLSAKLAYYEDQEHQPVPLPSTLLGKVVVFDPKWNFVVVNVGEDQGAIENAELLVSRNGTLIAKVKITSVQKDRSIANLVPGWSKGEISEGDVVIPANPAS